MSITIELDLPDGVAAQARAKGLLDPGELSRLITREVSAADKDRDFFRMVEKIRAVPGIPMTMDEINAEIRAVREAGR